MATGRPVLLHRAGPSGAPAAVLHPDDPLPRTWRVVSEWQYRGQRGAWLEYVSQSGSFRRGGDPEHCQVVYRTTAKHSPRTSTTGQGLSYAARGLVCQSLSLRWVDLRGWHAVSGLQTQAEADVAARAAYYGRAEREQMDIDREAAQAYAARLDAEAIQADPLGLKRDDSKLIEGWAEWSVRRARDYGVAHAMEMFDSELSDAAKSWGRKIRPMVEARVRAKLEGVAVPPPPVEGLLQRPEIPDVFRQAFE